MTDEKLPKIKNPRGVDGEHPAGQEDALKSEPRNGIPTFKIRTPDARHPITGMKCWDAMKQARWWWDKTGRHGVNKMANQEEVGRVFRSSGHQAPAILVKGSMEQVLPSNMLMGDRWDDLNVREKERIATVWHALHILDPLLEGEGEVLETTYRLNIDKSRLRALRKARDMALKQGAH